MKTLNTIQTVFKIGKIFSKIIYICCFVGICGCLVGVIGMLFGMFGFEITESLKIGGVSLHSVLETGFDVSEGTIWSAIAVGMILCIGEYFVSAMAYRYFDNELKAGTPFTIDGANELMHLGISAVWIPIVSAVLAQVAQNVIAHFMENVEKLSLDGYDSVSIGILIIVMSLLCNYGAQCKEKENDIL